MEQEFEEKFNQIYDAIGDRVKAELKRVKRICYVATLIAFSIALVVNLVVFLNTDTRIYTLFTFVLALFVVGFVFVSSRQIYRKEFKLNVISAILNEYIDTLGYDPKKGFSVNKYREYGFDPGFNDYYSEDQIRGNLPTAEKVTVAEVRTKEVEAIKEKSGYTETKEKNLFHGMFGEVELHKSISARISLDIDSFMRKYSKDRIEMDSEEFESYFDLSADNRILAMQIFTSELLEKIIEIKKLNKHYNYELKIFDDKLIYSCGDLFEPPVIGIGVSRDRVKEYFRNIYYPFEILNSVVQNINYAIDIEIKEVNLSGE